MLFCHLYLDTATFPRRQLVVEQRHRCTPCLLIDLNIRKLELLARHLIDLACLHRKWPRAIQAGVATSHVQAFQDFVNTALGSM